MGDRLSARMQWIVKCLFLPARPLFESRQIQAFLVVILLVSICGDFGGLE